MKPLAFDFYCKAGGAARGFAAAGFEVVGIDIESQPNYPYWFVQMDALEALRLLIQGAPLHAKQRGGRSDDRAWLVWLRDASFIWASPPCLDNTTLRNAPNAKHHQDLIEPTRELLRRTGLPYVIENVDSPRARSRMISPVRLCGTRFNLHIMYRNQRFDCVRHRLFESNFEIHEPRYSIEKPCVHNNPVIGVYGGHVRCRSAKHGGRKTTDFPFANKPRLAAQALGLPEGSMTMDEYSNAVPPTYAQYIVRCWLNSRKDKTQ